MPNKKVNQKSKTVDILIWSPSARKPNLSTRDSILVSTHALQYTPPCTFFSCTSPNIAHQAILIVKSPEELRLRSLADNSAPSDLIRSLRSCFSLSWGLRNEVDFIRGPAERSCMVSIDDEVRKIISTKLNLYMFLVLGRRTKVVVFGF